MENVASTRSSGSSGGSESPGRPTTSSSRPSGSAACERAARRRCPIWSRDSRRCPRSSCSCARCARPLRRRASPSRPRRRTCAPLGAVLAARRRQRVCAAQHRHRARDDARREPRARLRHGRRTTVAGPVPREAAALMGLPATMALPDTVRDATAVLGTIEAHAARAIVVAAARRSPRRARGPTGGRRPDGGARGRRRRRGRRGRGARGVVGRADAQAPPRRRARRGRRRGARQGAAHRRARAGVGGGCTGASGRVGVGCRDWGGGGAGKKPDPFFLKISVLPPPTAKTPRLEGAALLHLLPAVRHRRSRPHPSARAIPLGSARCSLVCVRARRVRGGTGTRVAAVQQELHTERQPAPAAVHRKNPARRFPRRRPDPCTLIHRCDALIRNGSGEFDFRPN